MTYKEALNFDQKWTATQARNDLERYLLRDEKPAYKAVALGMQALEKQIPKKPIKANKAIEIDGQLFMNDDNEYWKCPICTLYDVPLRVNQRYCHYCGQALDWSDSNA